MDCFADPGAGAPTLIHTVKAEESAEFLAARSTALAQFARASGFSGKAGEVLLAPATDGHIERVLVGVGAGDDPFVVGGLPFRLPEGTYAFAAVSATFTPDELALAWALGAYQFDRYKKAERPPAKLAPPEGTDLAAVTRLARATARVRDLVNTPANDMGPEALHAAAEALAKEHKAKFSAIVGDALVEANHPLIHAVGRAAAEAPRLLEMTWGPAKAPEIAIVGKGVCFDSGGLNIKTGDGMRLMKKDMGGAAHAIALAGLVMEAKLAVRVRLLIPAVENAISGNAFRPSDVVASRAGLTVEIDNTDAEGRLVLADALAYAVEQEPRLIIDFATLTGAARVALGPEVAPFYTNDDDVAGALVAASTAARDPVWRMPLWPGYEGSLASDVADLKNSGGGSFAGSITAALFLQRFVKKTPWAHLDVYAWNPMARPGRPKGGEAQGLRAVFAMLEAMFPA